MNEKDTILYQFLKMRNAVMQLKDAISETGLFIKFKRVVDNINKIK